MFFEKRFRGAAAETVDGWSLCTRGKIAHVISPASVTDAPRASALLQATFEDGLNTVAGIHYRMTSALPEDRMNAVISGSREICS